MCLIPGIESYLYVDLTDARSGDIASLQSMIIPANGPLCIHIDYRLKGNVQLDISYKIEDTSLEKHRCCSLVADDHETWNSTDIIFPGVDAPYRIYFDAVILSAKYGGIDLDNILHLNSNCSLTALEGNQTSSLPPCCIMHHWDNCFVHERDLFKYVV